MVMNWLKSLFDNGPALPSWVTDPTLNLRERTMGERLKVRPEIRVSRAIDAMRRTIDSGEVYDLLFEFVGDEQESRRRTPGVEYDRLFVSGRSLVELADAAVQRVELRCDMSQVPYHRAQWLNVADVRLELGPEHLSDGLLSLEERSGPYRRDADPIYLSARAADRFGFFD